VPLRCCSTARLAAAPASACNNADEFMAEIVAKRLVEHF
jgi:hypothetical protein